MTSGLGHEQIYLDQFAYDTNSAQILRHFYHVQGLIFEVGAGQGLASQLPLQNAYHL